MQLGLMQLIAASQGVWVRGGVTVGNILHDDDVVFGPALNRAYELESKVAKFPRIVLDVEIDELKYVITLMEKRSFQFQSVSTGG